eukprot:1984056-Pleurochrysis_carterae.AAC.2
MMAQQVTLKLDTKYQSAHSWLVGNLGSSLWSSGAGNLLQVLPSKLASYGVLRAPRLEETRCQGCNLVHVGRVDMLAHHGHSGVEAAVTDGVPMANACTVQCPRGRLALLVEVHGWEETKSP